MPQGSARGVSRWHDIDHPHERREWTVSIDLEVSAPLADDSATWRLSTLMRPYAVAIAGGTGATRYGATFTLVHGGDALGVLRVAIEILTSHAHHAGLPSGRLVLLEAAPVTDE